MWCVGLIAATLLAIGQPPAEGKAGDHFARVEVRGTIEPWTYNPLTRDRYAVRCKGGEGDRVFVLDLPDDAHRDVAKKLNGRTVVVTGDITQRKEFNGDRPGTHTFAMAIQVKSLKERERDPNK
jgi:hypothetical protein